MEDDIKMGQIELELDLILGGHEHENMKSDWEIRF